MFLSPVTMSVLGLRSPNIWLIHGHMCLKWSCDRIRNHKDTAYYFQNEDIFPLKLRADAESRGLGWSGCGYITVCGKLSFEASLWRSHWGMKGWVTLYAEMQHRQQTGRQPKHTLCIEGWGKMGWDCWCCVWTTVDMLQTCKAHYKEHSLFFFYIF